MNRLLTFALFATVMIGVSAHAATMTHTSMDVGSELTKYTFTLNQDTDDPGLIGGADLTFTADQMNQINPFDLPTIFEDNNAAVSGSGASVDEDSQFLFNSADLLLAPGASTESTSQLATAFSIPQTSSLEPFESRDIAQVVVPTGTPVAWEGRISFAENPGQGQDLSGVIPEPASLALLGLGGLMTLRRRR